MKKKTKIIIVIVILLIIILASAITAVVMFSSNKEDDKKKSEIEWGDVYLSVLEDEDNFENMEDLKIQLADLDNDEVPEMIVYGKQEDKYLAEIYKANKRNKADVISVERSDEFDIEYLHNTDTEENGWYLVDDDYYEFEIKRKDYKTEETDYNKRDFKEVDKKVNTKVDFDQEASKSEIKEVFDEVESNYIPVSEIKENTSSETSDKETSQEEVKISDFVEYDDEIYYWDITESSRKPDGIYGNYDYVSGVKNKLVKTDKKGNKETVYEGEGCGNLAIVNDRIFTYKVDSTGYYTDIISIDLDGKDLKTYQTGKMVSVVDDIIICEDEKATSIFALDAETGETETIKEKARYIGTCEDIVYYEEEYYTAFRATGEKYLKIGTILDGEDEGIFAKLPVQEFGSYTNNNFTVSDFKAIDDNIFIIYGYYDGSANMFQEGIIAKLPVSEGEELASSDIKTLKGVTEKAYEYKEKDKTYLVYEDGKGIDVDAFVNTQVSLEGLNYYENVFIKYDYSNTSTVEGINYTEDFTGKTTQIISKSDLEGYGFAFGEENYTSIHSYSITENAIYIVIDNGLHNSSKDVGWRYNYDRKKTVMLKYDIQSGKVEKINEF